jgi:hypothetical protein
MFAGPVLAANQTGHGTSSNSGQGVSGNTGNQGNSGGIGNAGSHGGGAGGSTGGGSGSSGSGGTTGGGSTGAAGGAGGDGGSGGSTSGNGGTTGSSSTNGGGASSSSANGGAGGSSGSSGDFSLTIWAGSAPVGLRVAGKTIAIAPTRNLTAHQVMTWEVFRHCADPAVRLTALYPDGGFRFINYDHLSNLPVWRTAECMTAYGYEFHGMAFGGRDNFAGDPPAVVNPQSE